jgi:hypothetical protein
MSFFRFIIVSVLNVVIVSYPASGDGLDNTAPPEVLDIDDPFSRDLKRAADDATGGISFQNDNLGIQEDEKIGRALLGAESRAAIVASKYRILGLAVSRRPDTNQIYIDPGVDIISGSKPLKNYLRIGTHSSIDDARQQAINLKSSHGEYLDTSFVIRRTNDGPVDLDLGPFRDITHAERYCDMMLSVTYGLISDCYVVQQYPGIEVQSSFTSSAMVQFSASAVNEVIEDTSVFDLPSAAKQILTISEGMQLGRGSTVATKVIPSGIIIVDEIGNVVKLPLNFIPEDSFEEALPEVIVIEPLLIEEEGSPVAEEETQTAAEILLATEDENQ